MPDQLVHKAFKPSASGHDTLLHSDSDIIPEDDGLLVSPTRQRRAPSPLTIVDKVTTPLPKRQMMILLALAVAEPIHATQIYPYLAQLIGEIGVTGGNPSKIGYYAGLIDTTFFFTEAFFVLQWGRISDRIGRRPVLLTGVAGIALSSVLFGFSTSFSGIVLSRALAGVLNANFAVLRGAMAEILDPTNFARGIAFMPIMWSFGSTIGPLVGGSLSHPYERIPSVFGHNAIWQRHPYLLPCLFSAAVSMCAFALAFWFLKETLPSRKRASLGDTRGEYQLLESPSISLAPTRDVSVSTSPSLRSLLTPSLIAILINYALFSLLEVSLFAVVPIFLAAPLLLGGLDFTPSTIGMCLATVGLFNGVVQVLYFAKIHARWGSKKMLRTGMVAYAAIFILFPVVNWTARRHGVGFGVWMMLVAQGLLLPVAMMISGCTTILLTDATSPAALGAANGLAQTTASFLRALGPAGATSLFAASVEHNLAGGSFVFLLEAAVALIGVAASGMIKNEGPEREDNRYD